MRKRAKPRDWSELDIKFLQNNYANLGAKKCAELLGTTYHQTQGMARRLDLRMFRSIPWTVDEVNFLMDNFPTKLTDYCAESLGRSWDATHKKANSLGLKPVWKHWYISTEGYRVLCSNRDEKIQEHRYVMEQKLGRRLTSEEIVHHKDGNKLNNDPDNLEIMTRSEHMTHHWIEINAAKLSKGSN